MINLALTTEFTFQQCFGPVDRLIQGQVDCAGIADVNNTFGHIYFNEACKKHGVRPIFGVRLTAVETVKERFPIMHEVILLAKNVDGLREIYRLVDTAYQKFYYTPRVHLLDVYGISEDVVVIGGHKVERIDYEAVGPGFLNRPPISRSKPPVYVPGYLYLTPDDRAAYEALSSARGTNRRTFPGYLLSESEARRKYGDEAVENTHIIAEECNVVLPKAEMVRFEGSESIENLCANGARKRNIDLNDLAYRERYQYEINLIKEKGYVDYFLIVADLVNMAKRKLLVGPSRGSSAGSLVCYLMGITEVDPLKYDLLFERFIDVNRFDLPDIDIDFPDLFRADVIKYLIHKYGSENVKHLGTISRFKARSAIGTFAKAYALPKKDTEELKDAIIERSSGDARAAMCIADTFETTEIGQNYVKRFPEMLEVAKLENHASHSGIHAAGVLVSNEPISNFAGIMSRKEGSNIAGTAMLDHWNASKINLLKIDCLGLRTLSVLMEVADLIGMEYKDFYDLPLDDPKVFKIFNDARLTGIFQFDGNALRMVTHEMGVDSFDDINAITALARPGTLHSGGNKRFTERKRSKDGVKYFNDTHKAITKDTYGIVVYQEQTMRLIREVGGLSWADVTDLRRAMSKSYGDEYFGKYKDKFVSGAIENGNTALVAEEMWRDILSFGSYGFNKSHSVAYSMISYWTAWAKAYHPLEFATACLNHEPDDDKAVKLLREMVVNDGIEYTALDPDKSTEKWSIVDGKLLGGLTSIAGIGIKKAKKIIAARDEPALMTPGLAKALFNADTKFNILFPARHYYGHLYDEPTKHGLRKLDQIIDIKEKGEYIILGKLIAKNLRDLNEYNIRVKRGGDFIEKDNLFINLIIEDDTSNIMCSIGRYDFDRLGGKDLAESAKIGEDWFLVKGKSTSGWRGISASHIVNLKDWRQE